MRPEIWTSSGDAMNQTSAQVEIAGEIVRGVIDIHISRKNAMSHGIGEECGCEECHALLRELKKMGLTNLEWKIDHWEQKV
jgi:hypothetical protein